MANGAVITVDGVGRRFGDVVALADVSFRVESGHALALLGRNGAGKTTMLRILATVLVPTSGRAAVAGFDVVTQGRQVRDQVGLLTVNERSLYWRLTGRQNLRFFDRVAGGSAATFGARVGDLVERLDLAGFVDHRVGSLSAGQRQRLVLARALLRRPAVLLLDEPLRGLDDVSTGLVLGVLRAELERGAALVLGAPQLHELADLAPDRLVLDAGRVVP